MNSTVPTQNRKKATVFAVAWIAGWLVAGTVIAGVLAPPADTAETAATPTPSAATDSSRPAPERTTAAPSPTKPSPSPTTASPTPKAEPKPAWHTVAILSGSADKRGRLFTLHGDRARMVYTVNGGEWAMVIIYLLPEGTNLDTDGGFPEVWTDTGWTGTDSTELVNDAGRYYLEVKAANATWTIKIQEYR